jgi:hypothetical protein
MDKETKALIKEYYNKLPPALQQTIMSPDLEKKINRIAAAFNLDEDKQAILENEVIMVLLGLEMLKDFTSNLQRELETTYQMAAEIAGQVQFLVFAPLREVIEKKNLETEEEERSEETTLKTVANTEDPVKENLIKEIEHPTPSPEKKGDRAPAPSFVADKLTKTTKTGVEEIVVPPRQDKQTPRYNGSDPYREPPI